MRTSVRLAVTGCFALALFPAAALAQPRIGVKTDPQEALPTLDGSPRAPDFEQVRLSYDPAGGQLVGTARFYEEIPYANTLYFVSIQAGAKVFGPAPGGCLNATLGDPIIGGFTDPATSDGIASLTGYAGSTPATRSWSLDNRELSFTVAHSALAGRDLRCFDATLIANTPAGCSAPGHPTASASTSSTRTASLPVSAPAATASTTTATPCSTTMLTPAARVRRTRTRPIRQLPSVPLR
jgi:hypothetical protein